MKTNLTLLVLLLAIGGHSGTFVYQGRLDSDGTPANGVYNISFGLYPSLTFGTPVNDLVITNSGLLVSNGVFTANLDFGDVFDGTPYWLQIAVATNGSESFTILSPRQQIHAVPYSQHAVSASSLDGTLADGQVPASVPRLDGSNTFSGHISAQSFRGDGSGLSNIVAAPSPNALNKNNNLSDVQNMATARMNLGGIKLNLANTDFPPFFRTVTGAGDYEGQPMRTKYGTMLYWNGTGWRAEISTPGIIIAGSTNAQFSTAAHGNHQLIVANGTDNVLELRNMDPEHYSAVRFTDRFGSEKGAIGYANTGAITAPGDLYFESLGLGSSIWFMAGVHFIGGMQRVTGDFVWFSDNTTNTTIFRINRQHSQTTVAGLRTGIITVTNDYTVPRSIHTVFVNASSKTITLPSAVNFDGELHTVKLITAGTSTITSPQAIDGASTYTLLSQNKYATFQSDGANWWVVGGGN